MDLTKPQWELLESLVPSDNTGSTGRPRVDRGKILNGILWILRTGAQWDDLPARYGFPKTVHRRFQQWEQQGVMRTILRALADDLTKMPKDAKCQKDATKKMPGIQ